MALSAKEKEMLERLTKKADEPEAPPVGRSISATIDLGDPKQIALAIKHGFLTSDEVEDLKEEEEGKEKEGKEGDDTPKRRGYFEK